MPAARTTSTPATARFAVLLIAVTAEFLDLGAVGIEILVGNSGLDLVLCFGRDLFHDLVAAGLGRVWISAATPFSGARAPALVLAVIVGRSASKDASSTSTTSALHVIGIPPRRVSACARRGR